MQRDKQDGGKLEANRMTNLQALVEACRRHGPATVEELAGFASREFELNYESVRKRKAEAVRAGLLEVIGMRDNREVMQVSVKSQSDVGELIQPLKECDRAVLAELEGEIELAAQSFQALGNALRRIRDNKLYREMHKTFEAYCKDRWGLGRDFAYKTIAASEVASILYTIVDKNLHESHCRPLTKLKTDGQVDASLVIATYQAAEKKAPVVDGEPKLTAKLIEDEVRAVLKVDELSEPAADEFDPAEIMSVEDACKAARRCKSITPEYLAQRTGIPAIKIKHWLELSSDFVGQVGERQKDGSWKLTKVYVITDSQLERRTKSVSIIGNQSPTESFSQDVYEIENRTQAIEDTFGDHGRYSSMWKKLSHEDKRSFRSILKRTQMKLTEILPRILERLSDE